MLKDCDVCATLRGKIEAYAEAKGIPV
jgi:hypothetical protein